MQDMILPPDDTIVAISSGDGTAYHGIVRLSGPQAYSYCQKIFQADDGSNDFQSLTWERRIGQCFLDEDVVVTAQVYFFKSPRSYTTQDMVEFHLPGSPALLKMVLRQFLNLGARMAGPGEFTARAFYNNRIDLTQAEAVAQMINARSDDQLRAAGRLLEGKLLKNCKSLSKRIAHLLALVEADIDFSDEDIEIANHHQLTTELNSIVQEIKSLIDNSVSWQQLDHLPQVVLAGLANAGKSTLANSLLKMDRAITSSIAGTTRDLVTAPLALAQGECMLVDTAGLGEVEDPLGAQAQELSLQAVKFCDLLLFVIDASKDGWKQEINLLNELQGVAPTLIIANKMDLVTASTQGQLESIAKEFSGELFAISAKHDDNLSQLKRHIEDKLQEVPGCSSESIALTSRQRQSLEDGLARCQAALDMISSNSGFQTEFFALELRESLDYLGGISGKVTSNDVLGIIFSEFCIGK